MGFIKASKAAVHYKIGIFGTSGSGKTFSSLRMARGLAGEKGKVCLIDTEHQSSAMYADMFDFDVWYIEDRYNMQEYLEAINAAKEYDVVVVDSFSHIWEAATEYEAELEGKGLKPFQAWGTAKKKYAKLFDAILHSKTHVICTMRAKTEYAMEQDSRGKLVPRKVGLGPKAESSSEYEFNTVLQINMDHYAFVEKDRTRVLPPEQTFLIDEEVGQKLAEHIKKGGVIPKEPQPAMQTRPSKEVVEKNEGFVYDKTKRGLLNEAASKGGFSTEMAGLVIKEEGIKNPKQLTKEEYDKLMAIFADPVQLQKYSQMLVEGEG